MFLSYASDHPLLDTEIGIVAGLVVILAFRIVGLLIQSWSGRRYQKWLDPHPSTMTTVHYTQPMLSGKGGG